MGARVTDEIIPAVLGHGFNFLREQVIFGLFLTTIAPICI